LSVFRFPLAGGLILGQFLGIALAEGHGQNLGLSLAQDVQLGGFAGLEGGDVAQQLVGILHRLVAHGGDDITGLDPGLGCGFPFDDRRDQGALVIVHPQGLGGVFVNVLDGDAEPAALDGLALAQLGDDVLGHGGGDGKADPLTRGHDGGVDADDLAVEVDQRTTGVPRIDGGVGLDEVVKGSGADDPALGADDTERDGVFQAEGIADGQNPGPDLEIRGVAEFEIGQIGLAVDFQQRQVGFLVAADDFGLDRLFVVAELDLDLVGAVHHVVIGDDVAVRGDDEARAQGTLLMRLGHAASLALGAEESIELVEEVVHGAAATAVELFEEIAHALLGFDGFCGGDIDDGRPVFFHQFGDVRQGDAGHGQGRPGEKGHGGGQGDENAFDHVELLLRGSVLGADRLMRYGSGRGRWLVQGEWWLLPIRA